jgi:hypothetical protein
LYEACYTVSTLFLHRFVHAACDIEYAEKQSSSRGKVLEYVCPPCKNRDPLEAADFQGLTESLSDLVDKSGLQDIESFEMFKSVKGTYK